MTQDILTPWRNPMKTEDVVSTLRDLADEIERRGIEEDSVTAELRRGVVEITDEVEERHGRAVEWRCYAEDGHRELNLKFRYADWKETVQEAIDKEIERLTKEPNTEEA